MYDEGTASILSSISEFELIVVHEIQSGVFGGPGMSEDVLYAAGSDDFRGYVWQVPETRVLMGLRQEISADEWYAQEWPNVTGVCVTSEDGEVEILTLFTCGGSPAYSQGLSSTRHVPLQISTPLCRVNGEYIKIEVLEEFILISSYYLRPSFHRKRGCDTPIVTSHCYVWHRTTYYSA